MCLLLTVLLEIRGKILIFSTVEISIFPAWFHELYGSISHMFSVHFFEGIQEIVRVSKGNKAITSCFACSAISNHSCHLERRIATEDGAKDFVIDLIAEISAEDSIVILWPVLHSLIFPYFSCHFPHHSYLLFLLLFDLLALSRLAFPFLLDLLLSCLFLFFDFFLLDGLGFIIDGLLDLEGIHFFEFEHAVEPFI